MIRRECYFIQLIYYVTKDQMFREDLFHQDLDFISNYLQSTESISSHTDKPCCDELSIRRLITILFKGHVLKSNSIVVLNPVDRGPKLDIPALIVSTNHTR